MTTYSKELPVYILSGMLGELVTWGITQFCLPSKAFPAQIKQQLKPPIDLHCLNSPQVRHVGCQKDGLIYTGDTKKDPKVEAMKASARRPKQKIKEKVRPSDTNGQRLL